MNGERTGDAAAELAALMQEGVTRIADLDGLDELTRLEGYQWVFEYVSAMFEYYVHADPAHPVVMPMVTPFRRFLGDLADAKHCYVAKLSADHTYRLRCIPGDAAFVSITVHADESGGLAGDRSLGKLNHRELRYEPDGTFEIVIARDPHGPNTITIDDTVGSLMTREFFSTAPSVRREARWDIEVVGGAAPTRVTDEALAQGFAAAVVNVRRALGRFPRPVGTPVFGEAPVNEFADLFSFDPSAVVTWGNLDAVHTTMAYELDPDEALVIEGGPVVPCAWWGLSQNNRYLAGFGRGEPATRRGADVRVRPDGTWRAVLAARDPGTGDDWLSTAGHRHGVLRIRWLLPEVGPSKPTVTKVRLSS